VQIILSKPTESPRLHANGLGCIPRFLDDRLPGNPVVNYEGAIDKCVEELTNDIQEATRHLLPSVDPVHTRGPIYPQVFKMKLA
jgi:hypothetical protein